MKGCFLQRFTIIFCALALLQEVHPLVLKSLEKIKREKLSEQDKEIKTNLLYGRSKRFIENAKGDLVETDVAIYEPHVENKRKHTSYAWTLFELRVMLHVAGVKLF